MDSPPGPLPAAVFFDMDGTLLDTQSVWDAAWREEAAYLGISLPDDVRTSLIGTSSDATARTLLNLAHLDATPERISETNRRITASVILHFTQPIQWRPGAQSTLLAVRNAGIPTALVTSSETDIVAGALLTLGMHNFDAIVCGDHVGPYTKPHPMPYLSAATQLGVNLADCIAVEDSATGYRSARAAGCAVILIPHEAPVSISATLDVRPSLDGFNLAALSDLHARHLTAPRRSPLPPLPKRNAGAWLDALPRPDTHASPDAQGEGS